MISRRELLATGAAGVAALSLSSPTPPQTPKRGGTITRRTWDPLHFDQSLVHAYKTHVVISFTHSQKPFSDVRVRQAISLAMDRKEIIDATFEGVGVVNGPMFGNLSPLNWNELVLITSGRKTGREISTPLLFLERDGTIYVVASFGGSDTAPAWYLNLVANPAVQVERGWSRAAHRARPLPPAEKAAVWSRLIEMYPF